MLRDALISCMSAVTEATTLQTDCAHACHAAPVAWIVEWMADLRIGKGLARRHVMRSRKGRKPQQACKMMRYEHVPVPLLVNAEAPQPRVYYMPQPV